MDYQPNSHCKYLIALHLILVVKYRKKLLQSKIGTSIKKSVQSISETSDFSLEEIEIDKDHLHILMTISPKYSAAQHVRHIKQMTNQDVWLEFPSLKQQFWLEKTFWSDGYFACSVGNASAETIRKYIQEQG